MVWWSLVPNNCEMDAHSCDVNWEPLSEYMSIGTPKWAIQCATNAWTQAWVVVLERKISSGHLVNWFTTVRIWVNPFEDGRGPTRSM